MRPDSSRRRRVSGLGGTAHTLLLLAMFPMNVPFFERLSKRSRRFSVKPSPPVKRAPLAPFLVSWVLVSSMPAQAAEPAQAPNLQPTPTQIQAARELFSAARKDEDALRWADALEKLERVAAVKQTASVRYHIAL